MPQENRHKSKLPPLIVKRREALNPLYDPTRDGAPKWHSLSAQHFGDPPVGRSALDQKKNEVQNGSKSENASAGG